MATAELTVGRLNIIYRPMVRQAFEEAKKKGVEFFPISLGRKKPGNHNNNRKQFRLF